jgi:hypothetical protein
MASILENRPLFLTILEEPVFYRRYFRKWVEEGMEEARRLNSFGSDASPE